MQDRVWACRPDMESPLPNPGDRGDAGRALPRCESAVPACLCGDYAALPPVRVWNHGHRRARTGASRAAVDDAGPRDGILPLVRLRPGAHRLLPAGYGRAVCALPASGARGNPPYRRVGCESGRPNGDRRGAGAPPPPQHPAGGARRFRAGHLHVVQAPLVGGSVLQRLDRGRAGADRLPVGRGRGRRRTDLVAGDPGCTGLRLLRLRQLRAGRILQGHVGGPCHGIPDAARRVRRAGLGGGKRRLRDAWRRRRGGRALRGPGGP